MDSSGIIIKQVRETSGYGLRELARNIGCSSGTIGDIESGRRKISDDMAEKISKALAERLDLSYIAGLFDRKSSIGILKTEAHQVYNSYDSRRSPHYTVRVEFRSKHKILIDLIYYYFNYGSRTLTKQKTTSGNMFICHVFMAWSDNGGKVLEKLLPYLKLKRPQALLLLELREMQKSNRSGKTTINKVHQDGSVHRQPLNEVQLSKMEEIYVEVRRLNKAL